MYDIALIARCISPAGSMIAVNRKNLHTLLRYDKFTRSWAFLPCHRRLITRLRLFGLSLTIVVVVIIVLGCIYYIAAIGWDNWDIIFIFMQIFIFMRSSTQIRAQISLDFEFKGQNDFRVDSPKTDFRLEFQNRKWRIESRMEWFFKWKVSKSKTQTLCCRRNLVIVGAEILAWGYNSRERKLSHKKG